MIIKLRNLKENWIKSDFMKIGENVAIPPCKDCEERRVGCHSDCEKYKKWRKAKDEQYKEELEKRRSDIEYEHYVKSRQRKIRDKRVISEKQKRSKTY